MRRELLATEAKARGLEVTEAMVRRWIEGGGAEEAAKHGRDPDQLLADTRRNVAESRPNANAIVDWYVESVVRG